jgi:cysteine desulfurase/selenocysteine lyase
VHRGLYRRSVLSTRLYEEARETVARFLHARRDEIVFTMGCTDAINLVAWSWGRAHLKPGDTVLVSGLEHHAGIVPWQLVAQLAGARVEGIPVLDDGSLDQAAYQARLAAGGVKLVNCVHIANSLGTVNPVRAMIATAHAYGALFLLDAAQSAPHLALDVVDLDCDFLVFSGHKCYGPTGIGVLYGKSALLESMPPWRGGGEMIERVSLAGTTFAKPPARFEAGTPPITEAIGLAEALSWLMELGMDRVAASEQRVYAYAETALATVPGLRRIGQASERAGVLSFVLAGGHPADASQLLDAQGVAIRAGHHCAQPVMARFGIPATARISLGVHTTTAEIDVATAALIKAARMLA